MTEEKLRKVADGVLSGVLGVHGFERFEISSGYDHDGDPSLFITAHFRAGHGPVPGKASVTALSRLRDAFMSLGEDRFPYIRHRYSDDEYAGDEGSQRDHVVDETPH